MSEPVYNILSIIRGTTVDGPGLRTSIYFAGCNHKCPFCHNPHSWDPMAGDVMSLSEILNIVEEEDFDVTLSGGDPLFHPGDMQILIDEIKKHGRNIWLYTGYTWEEIMNNYELKNAISKVDIVVDGPFLQEFYDPDLHFRGSSNQKIINVKDILK